MFFFRQLYEFSFYSGNVATGGYLMLPALFYHNYDTYHFDNSGFSGRDQEKVLYNTRCLYTYIFISGSIT
jgi:hypothetical protein